MKFLIVTGDDFGRETAVNEAIECYHAAGVLSQASLMVNEPGVEQAVRIARRNPALCVGLHLTLCDGLAARISAVSDRRGNLTPSPALAGVRYAFSKSLEHALSDEIERQFAAFHALGLDPTYWDGHHHIHLHPTVLRVTVPIAQRYGFKVVRLVREPYPWHPFSLTFRWLSRMALPVLNAARIRYVDRVYGLSRTGRIDNAYLRRLIPKIPPGRSELYFHPGAEKSSVPPEHFKEMLQNGSLELTDSRAMLSVSEASGSVPTHSPVSAGAI